MAVSSVDERPHAAGAELRWAESWTFDFFADDGALGGWARLTTLPNLGTAWYHAFLVGPDRRLVAVVDLEVPVPDRTLEVRTHGLWATHICETPLDHWTIGLEAFGLGVDDPDELYGRQLGDRVPLGFDLEWEAEGEAAPGSAPATGYQQPCGVSGEILVGDDAIDFVGHGHRERRWGVLHDWDDSWVRVHGRVGDGSWVAAATTGTAGAPGSIRVDDLDVDPVALTPVELTDPEGRRTRAPRALCRLTTSDGRAGHGWVEWNQPQP